MKRAGLISSGMALVAAATIFWVATDPGQIAVNAAIGPNRDYVSMLKAKAERTGKQVVWTGRAAVDTGKWAILPMPTPVLFDKADIGRPLDKIRNRTTRREVEAVLKGQDALLATRPGWREETIASFLGDVAEKEASGQKVDPLRLEAMNALSPGFSIEEFKFEPKPPPDGCQLGDPECPGCYTFLQPFFCGFACVSCVP